MIEITRPFLPPIDEYLSQIEGIWDRNWLTNDGPLVRELEERLKEYLGVEHLLLVANGTMALQISMRALGLEGEIITTPFSHISTTSAPAWEGFQPRHVDIDAESWNLDPEKISRAVNARTGGILATHVYGNPCDVESIGAVAREHGLKVVYDAAHCFGTTLEGRSVLGFGDASAISFQFTGAPSPNGLYEELRPCWTGPVQRHWNQRKAIRGPCSHGPVQPEPRRRHSRQAKIRLPALR